ncbi:MAG: hypothetical protein ABID04_00440 [Patescibacteria group bacterium]
MKLPKAKFILKNWDEILLTLILLAIVYTNFIPKTFLIGWDNLMPELNIWMNLKRSFLAVWQQYQGLGLVGGMGHATELIRQILLIPLVLILPLNWVRYLWHFLMLGLGAFGVFYFLKKTRFKGKIAILGALFYLLNFGTIQYFWILFESFSTFWGFFPWLIFSFLKITKKPTKNDWLFFLFINLLAIPSFYVQTIFVVYLISLGLIFLTKNREKLKTDFFKKTKPFWIILLINSFWLLPFLYFLITNVDHPRLSIGNQMATEETFMRNVKHGTISDFLLLKGYYPDFPSGSKPLMEIWQNQLSKPPVLIIGYLIAVISLLGLLTAPNWLRMLFLLSATALLSATPPFSWIGWLLRQSPFLNQAFRSPFTKFIVPACFSFSILFAYGIKTVNRRLNRVNAKIAQLIPVLLFISLIFYSFPAFKGNFIYPRIKTQIPREYFELFEFFKHQPKSARIANLPSGNFWGWAIYRWGLVGSGFLWYGIEQPILGRAFDVWNLNNEQYYWQLNYALQNQDLELLEKVFEKYFVEFVVFDNSIIFPDAKNFSRLALKTKYLLDQSEKIKKVANFGQITVYQLERQTQPYLGKNLISATKLSFQSQDPIYQNYNDYFIDKNNPEVLYPFADLFTNRVQDEITFEVDQDQGQWLITKKLPENISGQLTADEAKNELLIPVNLDFDSIDDTKKTEELTLSPEDFIDHHHCAPQKEEGQIGLENSGDFLELTAKSAAVCVNWKEYGFYQKTKKPIGVKIEFEYLSSSDEWPKFCFWDAAGEKCLNKKDLPKSGFSNQWQKYSEQILIDPATYYVTNLAFILDAYNETEEKQIKYRNIKLINYYLPATAKEFSKQSFNIGLKKDSDKIVARIPRLDSPWFVGNLIERKLINLQPRRCNTSLGGEYRLSYQEEGGQDFVRLTSKHDDSCLLWYLPGLPLNQGWLIEVKHRNIKGHPLFVSAFDSQERYQFFHTRLDKNQGWQKRYFVIPSYREVEEGINLSFSNTSFNQFETINDLAEVNIIPINWDYLSSVKMGGQQAGSSNIKTLEANSGLWWSVVNLEKVSINNKLILPQSYDPGWKAFYFKGILPRFLTDHVRINGWANGWSLSQLAGNKLPVTVYIFFWPQLLEFLGFTLFALPIILIIRKK